MSEREEEVVLAWWRRRACGMALEVKQYCDSDNDLGRQVARLERGLM
jgi:hypothetical protein